jgi:hypothetical protein
MTESSETVGYSYSETTMMGGLAIPWTDYSTDPMGLAFTGNGTAVGVLRSQITIDAGVTVGELRFLRWTGGTWTPGFGQAALPVQPFPSLYINGGPSIAGSSTRAHAAFQGTDMKFYYAEYFNGSWSPTSEPMTAGTTQSTGPVPPAIVTLNDTPIAVFVGSNNDLYDQTRSGGTWQPANAHGVAGHAAIITPRIVALTQGAELLVVYTDSAALGLYYTIRSSGTWSTPQAIAGASSGGEVSLAPLAAGGAVLAFKGTDAHLHTSVLSASAPFTWSTPAQGVMGADPVLASPPVVATGATGAQAELLYLDMSAYVLYSARMNGGAWGPATYNGTASANLALATGN